ncbi:hypothetical protein Tco_0477478 [Tanacetum coccineum]
MTPHQEEESIPVYNTNIEDVTEEEEGFVGKRGFSGEEENIKDVDVQGNDVEDSSNVLILIIKLCFNQSILLGIDLCYHVLDYITTIVKTYDETGDLEDHLKTFTTAARVERWALHT